MKNNLHIDWVLLFFQSTSATTVHLNFRQFSPLWLFKNKNKKHFVLNYETDFEKQKKSGEVEGGYFVDHNFSDILLYVFTGNSHF